MGDVPTRVRLGDLDPRYLRNREARDMVDFAASLFRNTNARIPVGEGHFAVLWSEAARALREIEQLPKS